MSEKLTKTQQRNLERLGGVNPADAPIPRRQFLTQVGGTAGVVGGVLVGGYLLRDRWGMEGVKPPPPVRLKNYAVSLPPSRPSLVVVRSAPVEPRGFASKEEELKAREDQALAMVKRALDEMGGVDRFIT